MITITSWVSSNLSEIRPWTAELAAIESLKNHFYSFNPSMYYSIAITVMEKFHVDIHPRKKKSGVKRLFIRQYDYFRM